MLVGHQRSEQQEAEASATVPPLEIRREEVLGHEYFPLKLGRMERYMLWDDFPQYPKRFRVANRFAGSVDQAVLCLAVCMAVRRHAMLLAIPDSKSNPRYWQLPEICRCHVLWGEGNFQNPPPGVRLDWTTLEEYRGLIIWGRNFGGEAEIVFDFHHANCDGLGGRVFLKDLLQAYDTLIERSKAKSPTNAEDLESISSTVSWLKIDPMLLLERDRLRIAPPSNQSRPTSFVEKLINAFKFHAINPKPMRSSSNQELRLDEAKPSGQPFSVRLHTFSPDKTAKISKMCEDRDCRLNDLAVCLLSQAIFNWNFQHGSPPRGDRIRILIPTDLRTIRDRCLPAANRFGFGFVVVNGHDLERWDHLHATVSLQTERIRRLRLAQDFVTILGMIQKLPGVQHLAKIFLRLPIPLATAVLTNLGDVSRRHRRRFEKDELSPIVGGMRLLEIQGIPPLRTGTALGVGMILAAGRLSLAACMDPTVFGTECDCFFNTFIQAWIDWMEEHQNPMSSDSTHPIG